MKNNQTIAQFLGIKTFPFEIKNDQGKIIYNEYSNGNWWKAEYNTNGNETRFDDSKGYWSKREYDANGNQTRFEDSYGHIIDKRPKQIELTLAKIATRLNIPLELLRIKE